MKLYPKYKVTRTEGLNVIEFISTGKKGNIDKIVRIEPTLNPQIYNLAFGDKVTTVMDGQQMEELDDKVNSENGDRDIVLATVAATVYDYTAKYPERWIIFSGSDKLRTRLYRMAITKNYIELSKDFHIFGVNFNATEPNLIAFDSNTNFDGFILKRK